MNTWLVSDTHFGHKKLTYRPSNSDELILQSWRDNVTDEDIIYHLGDLAIGISSEELIDLITKLPGIKVLVKGNHDHGSDNFYRRCGFSLACTYVRLFKYNRNIGFVHNPKHATDDLIVHGHYHLETDPMYISGKNIHYSICPETIGYRVISLKEVIWKIV